HCDYGPIPHLLLPGIFPLTLIPPPPSSTFFPYTTLFRSDLDKAGLASDHLARAVDGASGEETWLVEAHRVLGYAARAARRDRLRSEEHTAELQSRENLVCRPLLEKKKRKTQPFILVVSRF